MTDEPGTAVEQPPRVVAEFVDYPQMLAGLRKRVEELEIKGEAFDEFAGIPKGYLSKLVGARSVRRIGMQSMGPLLSALGLKCVFVEDQEGTKRVKSRVPSANTNLNRPTWSFPVMTNRKWARISKLGAAARKKQWRKVPKKIRSEMMLALVKKRRWRKVA